MRSPGENDLACSTRICMRVTRNLAMLGSDLWLGERPTRRAYAIAQPTVAELRGGTASDQNMPNHSL